MEFSPGSRLTRLWVVVIRIQPGSAPPLPRFIPLLEPAPLSLNPGHQSLHPPRERAPPFFLPFSFERYLPLALSKWNSRTAFHLGGPPIVECVLIRKSRRVSLSYSLVISSISRDLKPTLPIMRDPKC